jgi:hypothetical protein
LDIHSTPKKKLFLFHPKGFLTFEILGFFTLDFCECPHAPPPRFGKNVPMGQMVMDHQWLQWHSMLHGNS